MSTLQVQDTDNQIPSQGSLAWQGWFWEVFLKESKAQNRKEEHKCETATVLHKTEGMVAEM